MQILRFNFQIFIYIYQIVIYVIGEYYESIYYNTLRHVEKETKPIDPFNVTNMTGFVYFKAINMTYPEDTDKYTDINVFGAVITRRVEYCQYVKSSESSSFFSTSEIETYRTKWVNQYVNSSDFIDQNYQNPPLEVVVSPSSICNQVPIGNININSSFFSLDLPLFYFDPTPELHKFDRSQAALHFEFIKQGYFYYSLPNKPTAKERIAKYLEEINQNEAMKNKTEKEKYSLAKNKLFDNCYSGEVRFQYRIYGPRNATYFGYLQNGILYRVEYRGYQFGITKRGVDHDLLSLIEYYMADEKVEDIHFTVVKIKAIADIILYLIATFHNDSLRFIYWAVLAACLNLTFKSFLWETWYLDLRFWLSVSLILVAVGYFFGLWRFPFQRTIETNIDVHLHINVHLDQQTTERFLQNQANTNGQQQLNNLMNQPINQQTNLPTNQQMNIPTNQQINQQTNLPTNQQINQQMNIPMNQQTNLPMNQQINQQMNIPMNQQINREITIPINQETTIPNPEINAPLNQQMNATLNIEHNFPNQTQINLPDNQQMNGGVTIPIHQEITIPINRQIGTNQDVPMNHNIRIHHAIFIPNQQNLNIRRRNPTQENPDPQ